MTATASHRGSEKRSAPGSAARRANSPWPASSTLTAKWSPCRIRRHVSESRAGQNDTRGGRRETAANELTISPSGEPSISVVTNATPVAKRRTQPAGCARARVENMLAAECDVADEVVGAVGAERVHEGTGADVAVGARERVAVEVAGAARRASARSTIRDAASLVKVFAAWVSANSAARSLRASSTSVAARESVAAGRRARSRSRRRAMRERASGSPRWRAGRPGRRRRLGDAERSGGVEQARRSGCGPCSRRRRRRGSRRAAPRAGAPRRRT